MSLPAGKKFSSLDQKYRDTLPPEIKSQFPLATLHADGHNGRALTHCMVSFIQNAVSHR